MANSQESTTSVNPLADHGDHDRVVMLSLHGDGTPAQVAPEMIGDKDHAVDATKAQFRTQAVSAVDVQERGVVQDSTENLDVDALRQKQEDATAKAEAAAESVVGELHKGLGDKSAAEPAGTAKGDEG